MRDEIDAVFASSSPERVRDDKDEFRYEMFNRSAACQAAVMHPDILAVVEPLLGEDCHVIANTAWRNPSDFPGGVWHCDAGPHIPRAADVPWDDRIPYPVFAVATHIYLQDCARVDGPTAVVPGSHRSGRLAPFDQMYAEDLSYDGRPPAIFEVRGGRRRAVRVGRLAPRAPVAARRSGPLLPAGALRPARHRPTHPHHRRGEPAVARGRRAGDDRSRPERHRSARTVLLRRLTPSARRVRRIRCRAGSRRCR